MHVCYELFARLPMVSKVQGAFFNLAKIREALFKLFLSHCSPNSTNVNNPAFLLREESIPSDDSQLQYWNHFARRPVYSENYLTMAFSFHFFPLSTFGCALGPQAGLHEGLRKTRSI